MAGKNMKRVTMELGGHAPRIVAEDADIELAVKSAGAAKFRNGSSFAFRRHGFLCMKALRSSFPRLWRLMLSHLRLAMAYRATPTWDLSQTHAALVRWLMLHRRCNQERGKSRLVDAASVKADEFLEPNYLERCAVGR